MQSQSRQPACSEHSQSTTSGTGCKPKCHWKNFRDKMYTRFDKAKVVWYYINS